VTSADDVGDELREELVAVGGGRLDLRVQIRGSGPPLIYLHPAAGLAWDPFLLDLAKRRTIHAPLVPGTAPEDPDAIHEVADLWDLVLLYEEGLSALRLEGADLIGASFGGMLAAELQAGFPDTFGRLVLLDPIGLWRDDAPVANWLLPGPEALPGLLFAEPESDVVRAVLALPEDADGAAEAIATTTWALGCTAKFVWPVPDRGLDRRLHRVTASTLVIWGAEDALVPVVYAQEWGDRITTARVEILEGCGHVPQVERRDETLARVEAFLDGRGSLGDDGR
jgi:pimeloyl-ACP methyl ester carboxylesterase